MIVIGPVALLLILAAILFPRAMRSMALTVGFIFMALFLYMCAKEQAWVGQHCSEVYVNGVEHSECR